MFGWDPYVPVAIRRQKAKKKINQLRKKGKIIQTIEIQTRNIVTKFWGKLWCKHLESFSDFDNRLPRGKSYVRNGSVAHLEIKKGCVEALVAGSLLYNVNIKIKELSSTKWNNIKKQCVNQIGTVLELLKGKISDNIMKIIADQDTGLFPKFNEIDFSCTCPDVAYMCKHVAAVFYGVGNRLDTQPELLFFLRNVDINQLIKADLNFATEKNENELLDSNLSDIFDIEFDETKKSAPPKILNDRHKKSIKQYVFKISSLQFRKIRKKRALSVNQFAKLLKVSPSSVYKWEATEGDLNLQKCSKRIIKRLMKK